MHWFKKTLAKEQNADGKLIADIPNEFSAQMAKRPLVSGSDVALFTQKGKSADYSFSFYFSPECANYCPELLRKLDAVATSKPSASDAEFLLGDESTSRLLG